MYVVVIVTVSIRHAYCNRFIVYSRALCPCNNAIQDDLLQDKKQRNEVLVPAFHIIFHHQDNCFAINIGKPLVVFAIIIYLIAEIISHCFRVVAVALGLHHIPVTSFINQELGNHPDFEIGVNLYAHDLMKVYHLPKNPSHLINKHFF